MVSILALAAGTLAVARAAAPPAEGADLRPQLDVWGLSLRSQGKRGTCSVFAVVAGMEYALAKRTGKGVFLSVEFLNWASNEALGRPKDGGFFHDLWKSYERMGICREDLLPYQARYDAEARPSAAALDDARGTRDLALRLHWIKPWDVRTGLTDGHFRQICATLDRGWPVLGGLRWPKKAQWREKVLQVCPPEEVFDGHSVLLVGYRDDPSQPGRGVFLIRDSGSGGQYAALPYEYVRAYMNDAAWVE